MINSRHWLECLHISETIILWSLAAVAGLTTAAVVWLFKRLIDLTHTVEYSWLGGWLSQPGNWTLVLLPILGGRVVGLLVHFITRTERYDSLRPGSEIIIPHGDTLIRPGNVLVLISDRSCEDELLQLETSRTDKDKP
jgi:H+/Cl- antiporter ClcA